MDFWYGMMVMQVMRTAKPGDFAFLRYDQGQNLWMNWGWNSKTAQGLGGSSDDNPASCYCQGTGYSCGGTCATSNYPSNYIIGGGYELADPNLPPGQNKSYEVRSTGCTEGTGAYTCGSHAFTGGVVCVQ
jgi:hypothetical protein